MVDCLHVQAPVGAKTVSSRFVGWGGLAEQASSRGLSTDEDRAFIVGTGVTSMYLSSRCELSS